MEEVTVICGKRPERLGWPMQETIKIVSHPIRHPLETAPAREIPKETNTIIPLWCQWRRGGNILQNDDIHSQTNLKTLRVSTRRLKNVGAEARTRKSRNFLFVAPTWVLHRPSGTKTIFKLDSSLCCLLR